ncbi:MAG: glycosyltransferase family 4 protein [Nanoarchaeota archaeon]
MKKNLDVFFNPGVHPQFAEIFNHPPKGVKYHYNHPKGDHNSEFTRKKRFAIVQVHKLGIPRMAYIKNSGKYDLIHSTRGILPLNKKPWIVDVESGAAFSGLSWKNLKKPLMQALIKKYLSSENCKKIIPQSEAAKRSLLENIDCSGFKDKIETVYLAWHTTKLKRKKSDTVRISFIGRGFYDKGGNDLQEAFKILNKKYPGKLSLKYKGIVPKNKRLKLPNVKYLDNIPDPNKFYEEIFGDCDIYVQPTTVDSYGVSILEAMSTGLPIVCTDDFTLPEFVKDGYNGFLVKSPINWYDYRLDLDKYARDVKKQHPETVRELVEKISILIENEKLRKKMGKNSFEIVSTGKLSINERNKKLLRIYREALG